MPVYYLFYREPHDVHIYTRWNYIEHIFHSIFIVPVPNSCSSTILINYWNWGFCKCTCACIIFTSNKQNHMYQRNTINSWQSIRNVTTIKKIFVKFKFQYVFFIHFSPVCIFTLNIFGRYVKYFNTDGQHTIKFYIIFYF